MSADHAPEGRARPAGAGRRRRRATRPSVRRRPCRGAAVGADADAASTSCCASEVLPTPSGPTSMSGSPSAQRTALAVAPDRRDVVGDVANEGGAVDGPLPPGGVSGCSEHRRTVGEGRRDRVDVGTIAGEPLDLLRLRECASPPCQVSHDERVVASVPHGRHDRRQLVDLLALPPTVSSSACDSSAAASVTGSTGSPRPCISTAVVKIVA